jgi:hypothetical protein
MQNAKWAPSQLAEEKQRQARNMLASWLQHAAGARPGAETLLFSAGRYWARTAWVIALDFRSTIIGCLATDYDFIIAALRLLLVPNPLTFPCRTAQH